ncbi:MAG: leucyl aminopeptidase [Gammaproteobacteria bacterium]|jgi:leucyl aminopeptidase|nr:leucyl aminopeptidase [Gammaproteobacteria bacterium]MBT6315686.1 leucyl aminopeptidase [Gammaproteobacteria bacterium]MDG1180012.1 leucyl aminopeptidase [Gammaproteobacteria bacterium]MDG1516133.1 leucyl aminopeptidase [Gammaproteobacteria bacterium]MDG1794771.1 leucyl aminopeptidase [Gammaproteobacteria bacterium]
MKTALKTSNPVRLVTDCLVIAVAAKNKFSAEAKEIDIASGKRLARVLENGDFDGSLGTSLMLQGLEGVKAKRVLLVGCGDKAKLSLKEARKLLVSITKSLLSSQAKDAHLALASLALAGADHYWLAERLAQELEDASYSYSTTKSTKAKASALKSISLAAPKGTSKAKIDTAFASGVATGRGINCAKELGNLPGNICTPTYLAQQAIDLAKGNRALTVKVLSEKQMARLGMGSLLSVSAGSSQEAQLIVMEYKGAKVKPKADRPAPHMLVGKGITFDTGGISLKAGAAMDEMKFDMCGAASVIGTMAAVVEMALPIDIVAIVAAAENMPSGKATKPGDVVTSMSGLTIEILNTDAEGRLVLCDALTYGERYKPASVIDVATLTGAAVATFGSHVSAMLSNDDALAAELSDCGNASLDQVWQLPLHDEYQHLLDSNFADIANIGGPRAGTITAACFLSRFTKKFKWAHLDIAGSAWNSGAAKGATGRPVSLLLEYLRRKAA